MEVDRSKRNRSSETSSPQPPTPSTAERRAPLEQDALEKERIARQARVKADMAGAVLRAEQALEKEMKKTSAKNDAAAAPKAAPVPAPVTSNAAKTPAPVLPEPSAANPASPTSPSSAASTSSRRTRVLPAPSKLNKKGLLFQAALHDPSSNVENQILHSMTVPALRDYLYKLDEELYKKKIADGGSSSPSTPELMSRIHSPTSKARRTKFHKLG